MGSQRSGVLIFFPRVLVGEFKFPRTVTGVTVWQATPR